MTSHSIISILFRYQNRSSSVSTCLKLCFHMVYIRAQLKDQLCCRPVTVPFQPERKMANYCLNFKDHKYILNRRKSACYFLYISMLLFTFPVAFNVDRPKYPPNGFRIDVRRLLMLQDRELAIGVSSKLGDWFAPNEK